MSSVKIECESAQSDALPTSAAHTVRIVRHLEGLESLADAWNKLGTRSHFPMQQYEWARAAADSLAAPGRLRIIVLEDSQPLAILPLIKRSALPGRLELLSGRELYEPMDALLADPSVAPLLAHALLRLGLPLLLNRLFSDSPLVKALEVATRDRGVLLARSGKECPRIPLDDSWTQPEGHFNARRRSDLRRARRIAEQIGPVSFQVFSPTPEEIEPLWNEALRVEASGWKGFRGSALSNDPMRGAFYRRYAAAACQRGRPRLCFLRIGDRTAAMQIAEEYDNRFWLLKIGHDPKFERCSPGTLLMLETVRYAALGGLSSFEFLGKAEPWTQMWTRTVRECVSLVFYPTTARGGMALAADAARLACRRFDSLVRGKK